MPAVHGAWSKSVTLTTLELVRKPPQFSSSESRYHSLEQHRLLASALPHHVEGAEVFFEDLWHIQGWFSAAVPLLRLSSFLHHTSKSACQRLTGLGSA